MKSVIRASPYEVGEVVYITSECNVVTNSVDSAINATKISYTQFDMELPEVFPVLQLKVVSIRLYRKTDDPKYDRGYTPVISASEETYKVMRNNVNRSIAILTRDMYEVVRLEWPASKPFHDALGPIEEDGTRQIMYVSALNVDGNYKLIEVLDDQDW